MEVILVPLPNLENDLVCDNELLFSVSKSLESGKGMKLGKGEKSFFDIDRCYFGGFDFQDCLTFSVSLIVGRSTFLGELANEAGGSGVG
jgi:hypothetical protein